LRKTNLSAQRHGGHGGTQRKIMLGML